MKKAALHSLNYRRHLGIKWRHEQNRICTALYQGDFVKRKTIRRKIAELTDAMEKHQTAHFGRPLTELEYYAIEVLDDIRTLEANKGNLPCFQYKPEMELPWLELEEVKGKPRTQDVWGCFHSPEGNADWLHLFLVEAVVRRDSGALRNLAALLEDKNLFIPVDPVRKKIIELSTNSNVGLIDPPTLASLRQATGFAGDDSDLRKLAKEFGLHLEKSKSGRKISSKAVE